MDMHYTRVRPRNSLEWLAWIGQPMLYDGALCVERDYDPTLMYITAVSLDGEHRIKAQLDWIK